MVDVCPLGDEHFCDFSMALPRCHCEGYEIEVVPLHDRIIDIGGTVIFDADAL